MTVCRRPGCRDGICPSTTILLPSTEMSDRNGCIMSSGEPAESRLLASSRNRRGKAGVRVLTSHSSCAQDWPTTLPLKTHCTASCTSWPEEQFPTLPFTPGMETQSHVHGAHTRSLVLLHCSLMYSPDLHEAEQGLHILGPMGSVQGADSKNPAGQLASRHSVLGTHTRFFPPEALPHACTSTYRFGLQGASHSAHLTSSPWSHRPCR